MTADHDAGLIETVLAVCHSSRPAFIREANGVDWHRGVSICTCGDQFTGTHRAHVAARIASVGRTRWAVRRPDGEIVPQPNRDCCEAVLCHFEEGTVIVAQTILPWTTLTSPGEMPEEPAP